MTEREPEPEYRDTGDQDRDDLSPPEWFERLRERRQDDQPDESER